MIHEARKDTTVVVQLAIQQGSTESRTESFGPSARVCTPPSMSLTLALVPIDAAGVYGWLITVVTQAPIPSHTRQRLDRFGIGDCQIAQGLKSLSRRACPSAPTPHVRADCGPSVCANDRGWQGSVRRGNRNAMFPCQTLSTTLDEVRSKERAPR